MRDETQYKRKSISVWEATKEFRFELFQLPSTYPETPEICLEAVARGLGTLRCAQEEPRDWYRETLDGESGANTLKLF